MGLVTNVCQTENMMGFLCVYCFLFCENSIPPISVGGAGFYQGIVSGSQHCSVYLSLTVVIKTSDFPSVPPCAIFPRVLVTTDPRGDLT